MAETAGSSLPRKRFLRQLDFEALAGQACCQPKQQQIRLQRKRGCVIFAVSLWCVAVQP